VSPHKYSRSTREASISQTPSTESPKTILIADGNDRVADLLASVFATGGWTVTRYTDAERADEALRGRARYDAVLLGYRFEGTDGVELIRRARALEHRKDLPIVLVTGTATCEVVAAALAAGADDVVYKPADVDVLVATVTKCVERRRDRT